MGTRRSLYIGIVVATVLVAIATLLFFPDMQAHSLEGYWRGEIDKAVAGHMSYEAFRQSVSSHAEYADEKPDVSGEATIVERTHPSNLLQRLQIVIRVRVKSDGTIESAKLEKQVRSF
ncbi:MAG TPA: hypothetical protein VHE55_14095 [Fimbriimonadaceae bacterium]|nr:hypothetical protein [Fimbriimonadaceae bacterium]